MLCWWYVVIISTLDLECEAVDPIRLDFLVGDKSAFEFFVDEIVGDLSC